MSKKFKILIILLNLVFINSAYTQYVKEIKKTRILFIFDASNSMNGKWESGKKIDIARNLLIKLIDSLDKIDNTELAIRIYGHQNSFPPQVCTDTKLEVPFAENNAQKIRDKLKTIVPKGTTPIAYSLELSGGDFPPCKNCRNVIVLITDGIEACEGDPCAIALMLQKKGITLKPFVIGIGLDLETKKAFECVGKFYDADKEKEYENALDDVMIQAFNQTTVQINLLDIYNKPSETDVNLTFYNQDNGKIIFNAIHTINKFGNPDTIFLQPQITYKIVVNTIPKTVIENVKIKPRQHNIIEKSAPQGFLIVKQEKGNNYNGNKFIVRKSGEPTTLNSQIIAAKEKYLVGKYDIELLTLPRLYFNYVQIEQSKTKTISFPEPGIANFLMPSNGFGSVYVKTNKNIEWVCNLNEINKEVLTLQPGNYIAIYRPALAKKMNMSIEKEFTVLSGRSVTVKF
ncbi:MAG: VWA domain-containing protein [Bacteroidales bacterium]|nr:VWA domain-containing protein [Bacteroidales bacterium]MBN2758286.1 VWA domain-containing protein [Bacteroidales bacterium]